MKPSFSKAARIAALLLASTCALQAGNLPKAPASAVNDITPVELREHLSFLASDELGGRYTLSPNFPIAARYLATRLQAWGYKPAGDNGTFLQHFDLISAKPKADECSLSITSNGQTTEYKFGDFFTQDAKNGEASGQLVFVGYGLTSPEQKYDDYAGLDVKGKIVLLLTEGDPPKVDRSRLKDSESGEPNARAHGAVGVISLPSRRYLRFMKSPEFKTRIATRFGIRLAKTVDGTLPTIILAPDAAEKLLEPLGMKLEDLMDAGVKGQTIAPKALQQSAKLRIAVEANTVPTQNVVGVLEGSDPKLKDEYVTFSAHYDHLETRDGRIFPGADDDGSGTAAVLTIARALAETRPKRSLMIIFHAGEELGLLGSRYNTDFGPAVPLNKIVADLNIDMIGRSKPSGDTDEKDKNLTDANTVYLVGADRISKELHQISEQTNQEYEKLSLNYLYNDPKNEERIYYRSDHWNYAKHGIPIIFYFDGTHVDYHQPTDTVDKIDFQKMTKISRLVLETGWRLANLDHRVVLDKQ